jgi:hypothetical protein
MRLLLTLLFFLSLQIVLFGQGDLISQVRKENSRSSEQLLKKKLKCFDVAKGRITYVISDQPNAYQVP